MPSSTIRKKPLRGKRKKVAKTPPAGVVTAKVQASSQKSVLPNQKGMALRSKGTHPHANYHAAVCGQVDPFCSHALGARIPDGNAGRSIAYQVRGSFTIGTGAGSVGGALVLPFFPYTYQTATPAGSTITWGGTQSAFPAASAFTSLVGQFRLVSWGIKIGSILNATNNGGYVIVASASQLNTTVTVPDMEFDDARMFPLNTFAGTTWFSKRLSNYALYLGGNNNTLTLPQSLDNYTACVIQVQGTASTPASVLCEVVVNYEFTPVQDSASALLAAKGPVKNDAVLTGASHVQTHIPATIMKSVDDAGSVIADVVKSSPLGMIATIGSDLLKAL